MQMCVPQSERYKLEDQVCIKNQQHIKVVFFSRSFHFCLTWKSPKNWWYMSKAEKIWFLGRTSSEISPGGYPRAHHATLSTQTSCLFWFPVIIVPKPFGVIADICQLRHPQNAFSEVYPENFEEIWSIGSGSRAVSRKTPIYSLIFMPTHC